MIVKKPPILARQMQLYWKKNNCVSGNETTASFIKTFADYYSSMIDQKNSIERADFSNNKRNFFIKHSSWSLKMLDLNRQKENKH